MATQPANGQITTLLSNDLLGKVERLRLNASRRFTNRSRGEHLHSKGGQSTEFADYRDYVEGDDTRFVDWNIFARLQRPYIKLFQHEEEMHVVLLVDASSSMRYGDKALRARQYAAGFGIMGLFAGERVSAYTFTGKADRLSMLRPCTGRGSMSKLLTFLEGTAEGGDMPLNTGIDSLLKHHRGRGVVVVLSDFLTSQDLASSFNRLHGCGLEIFALQILSPAEIEPEITTDLRLIDCEDKALLDVSNAADLLSIYQEYRLAHQFRLERLCTQRSGRFLSVSTQEQPESVLMDLLRRKGWVV